MPIVFSLIAVFSAFSHANSLSTGQTMAMRKFMEQELPTFAKVTDFSKYMTEERERKFFLDLNNKLADLKLPKIQTDSPRFNFNFQQVNRSSKFVVKTLEISDGEQHYCLPCQPSIDFSWAIEKQDKTSDDIEGKFENHLKCIMGLQGFENNPRNRMKLLNASGSQYYAFTPEKETTGFFTVTAKSIYFFPASLPNPFNSILYKGKIENDPVGKSTELLIRGRKDPKISPTFEAVIPGQSKLKETALGSGRERLDEKSIALVEVEIDKHWTAAMPFVTDSLSNNKRNMLCKTLFGCKYIQYQKEPAFLSKLNELSEKYSCEQEKPTDGSGPSAGIPVNKHVVPATEGP